HGPARVRGNEGPLDAAASRPAGAGAADAANMAALQRVDDRTAIGEVPAEVLGDVDRRNGQTAGAVEQDGAEGHADAPADGPEPPHVDRVDGLVEVAVRMG